MKKTKLYSHHHRFNYIVNSSALQDSTTLAGSCPIDKCMLLADEDYSAVIEYTDGAIELQGQESTSFAKMAITKIQSSGIKLHDKRKFYFRPLYSETLSKSLKEMLHEEGWQLKHIMPWSYYAGNYQYFVNNRKSLREIVFQNKNRKDFLFLGNLDQKFRPCKIDKSLGTKYPVSHCDVLKTFTEENFLDYPNRKTRIINFEKSNNCKVHIESNVAQGSKCFDLMNSFKILVQPHGVSVRHNIYEGMCLGIPSVVEKTSYNKSLFSLLPMSDFSEKPEDISTQEMINKMLHDDNYMKELREKLITFFEQNMLPDAIVSSIFEQVKEG
jgi:hypothetical protein